jgi:hypothetical protein
MSKIDIIIDALEAGLKLSDGFISEWNQINKALAAARELQAEKQEAHKEWVGLTDEEIAMYDKRLSGSGVARDIEAKLKEKNSG